MALSDLINYIKNLPGGAPHHEINNLLNERIALPGNFINRSINLEIGDDEEDSSDHIVVSAACERPLSDMQLILDKFLLKARELKFKKGVAAAGYDVFWETKAFMAENALSGLFDGKVALHSVAYTRDASKGRLEENCQTHDITAVLSQGSMVFTARGSYNSHLSKLISIIAPQHAALSLSKQDLDRVSNKIAAGFGGKYDANLFAKQMRRVPKMHPINPYGSFVELDFKDAFEAVVRTKDIPIYEEFVGKALLGVSEKQDSRITELHRTYGIMELIGGKRLSDLQALARDIPAMELGVFYNHPLLTNKDAQNLLESDMNKLSEALSDPRAYASNPNFRQALRTLAVEHFGADIAKEPCSMAIAEYVEFLKGFGYEPSQSSYAGLECMANDKHLLECLKQSLAKDPRDSVKRYREIYQNTLPELHIFAANTQDASKSRKLKLPSQAKLYSFDVGGYKDNKSSCFNDLILRRMSPFDKFVQFGLRTRIDSPILLPLQDYVCEEMGIKFK